MDNIKDPQNHGSNPCRTANFAEENEDSGFTDTLSTQNPVESETKGLKFPKAIKFRGKKLAKIYGKSATYPQYRVAWSVAGKRRMKAFDRYGGEDGALAFAEKLVSDLHKGSQATALTDAQASDALAALQKIESFRQQTGQSFSLLVAVSEYCAAKMKAGDRSLGECLDGFMANLAVVKRKDLQEAVNDFIKGREPKTVAKDGKRPQLSAHYLNEVKNWLDEFAKVFPGHAVCDLTKEHLQTYMAGHAKRAAKTRNERRNVIRMSLKWCVRQDYLAQNHRLLEADALAKEIAEPEEIEFFTAAELQTLLDNANEELSPVIALIALGGVRSLEAVRLTWENVFRVPGHIEITVAKSKTRSRRLTTIGDALAKWLAPYAASTGPVWPKGIDMFQEDFKALREKLEIPRKRNGLRHGFVSAHFALHANENLTAAESGNSPAMIHRHYKGLMTKAEAEKWFVVAPATSGANIIPMPAAAAGLTSP